MTTTTLLSEPRELEPVNPGVLLLSFTAANDVVVAVEHDILIDRKNYKDDKVKQAARLVAVEAIDRGFPTDSLVLKHGEYLHFIHHGTLNL